MPKRAKELSAATIKKMLEPGLHPVGCIAGLCIKISASGSKTWVFRKMVCGRRQVMTIGHYPEVSLARAREIAREALNQIWRGSDPGWGMAEAPRDRMRA